jgi:predicted nucleic acid-binding protein
VLVWCVRQTGTQDQQQRADWLLQELETANAQIMISTVVVSEFLAAVDPTKHTSVIAAIAKDYVIKPFDVHCASIAASLFISGKSQRPAKTAFGRECLRSDAMIIATAKAHKAKLFYTNDDDCLKLARTVFLDAARNLPTNSPHLFSQKGSK